MRWSITSMACPNVGEENHVPVGAVICHGSRPCVLRMTNLSVTAIASRKGVRLPHRCSLRRQPPLRQAHRLEFRRVLLYQPLCCFLVCVAEDASREVVLIRDRPAGFRRFGGYPRRVGSLCALRSALPTFRGRHSAPFSVPAHIECRRRLLGAALRAALRYRCHSKHSSQISSFSGVNAAISPRCQ